MAEYGSLDPAKAVRRRSEIAVGSVVFLSTTRTVESMPMIEAARSRVTITEPSGLLRDKPVVARRRAAPP